MHDDYMGKKSDIGNFYEILREYKAQNQSELSFRSGKWADFEQWKMLAKEKVIELLNYSPKETTMDPVTLNIIDKGEYIQEEIEFSTTASIRVKGTLLIPQKGGAKLPAIIALHDHGGFYYFGREKILECGNEPELLKNFKTEAYGGRSWANELLKRGYVVLCIDAFYFGSRKAQLDAVSEEILDRCPFKLEGIEKESDKYIDTYNKICQHLEGLLVKHIFIAGTTWPGILFYDDKKCVDYLHTRKEVDTKRIGCCGLSLGGFRSAHLAALDSRIKCSVVAGWMPTYESLLFNKLRDHTYMIYIPGLTRFMDLSDVMCLTAPNSLFVQQCTKDILFNVEGMLTSCLNIKEVYEVLGQEEKFKYEFYDNKHEFNLKMQEDAFEWFDRWLKQ